MNCPSKGLLSRVGLWRSGCCDSRVYRGTSWRDSEQRAILAHEGHFDRTSGLPYLGFRVVRVDN